MPRTRHDQMSAHAQLARALRWLRHDRRLTQAELREAVRAAGGEISVIYIQQIEAGRKRPSPALLDRLLSALGSDRDELGRLLEDGGQNPPAESPPGGWRPSRRDPVRQVGPVWSDEVALAAPASASPAAGPSLELLVGELSEIAGHLDPIGRRELLQAARRLSARRR